MTCERCPAFSAPLSAVLRNPERRLIVFAHRGWDIEASPSLANRHDKLPLIQQPRMIHDLKRTYIFDPKSWTKAVCIEIDIDFETRLQITNPKSNSFPYSRLLRFGSSWKQYRNPQFPSALHCQPSAPNFNQHILGHA